MAVHLFCSVRGHGKGFLFGSAGCWKLVGFVLSAVVDGRNKSLNAAPYITQAELPAMSSSTHCSALYKCARGVLLDPGTINSSLCRNTYLIVGMAALWWLSCCKMNVMDSPKGVLWTTPSAGSPLAGWCLVHIQCLQQNECYDSSREIIKWLLSKIKKEIKF